MTEDQWRVTMEAQFVMGHAVPGVSFDRTHTAVVGYSWDVDQVRQALSVPLDALWSTRILELEGQKLVSFCFHVAPVTYGEDGVEQVIPGWEDEPREKWGSFSVSPEGVLLLARLYNRPYVRYHESQALYQHWMLTQELCAARCRQAYDPETFTREYPEDAALWRWREAMLQDEEDTA